MNARVLLVASEAVPLIKTGGLADVISSLARALINRGIEVTVMMPGYPAALERAGELQVMGLLPDLPGGPGRLLLGAMPDSGVPVVLLKTARFDERGDNPYIDARGSEYEDNALCFADLAHAAVAVCAGKTALAVPHIVHANDWHAGLIPLLLKQKGIHHVGSLLTIHNLAFQGNYPIELAPSLGIPDEVLTPDGIEFWGQLSFIKAGILFADRISTVSDSYAKEILTPHFGHGMDGLLKARKENLFAIRNGVDADTWNPSDDSLIARTFSFADMRGKSGCKRDLQALFGLPIDPFAPILAIGSRITHQKMADVALAALPAVLKSYPRAQLAVLGCGERCYEEGFLRIAQEFPHRAAVHIGYDERRAHALHAGADMLLHGSRFEPFGLTPLYSMRYGTIPIASRVGGMADSITDAGLSGSAHDGANGILFDGEQARDMTAAIARAFELYAKPSEWHAMQRNAMSADFSWDGPAAGYVEIYSAIAPATFRETATMAPETQSEEIRSEEAQGEEMPQYKLA